MKKVLIVEDNKINAEILSLRLKRKGFEIDIAEDGTIAIKKSLQEDRYNIILMDINIPYHTGWEVIEKIRKQEQIYFKNIPIIILTACVFPEDKKKGIEVGAEEFFEKPINFQALLQSMEKLLVAQKI